MQTAVIQGEVRASQVLYGRRMSLLVKLQDGTGLVSLRFITSTARKKPVQNRRLGALLEARRDQVRGLELYHPEYQLVEDIDAPLSRT